MSVTLDHNNIADVTVANMSAQFGNSALTEQAKQSLGLNELFNANNPIQINAQAGLNIKSSEPSADQTIESGQKMSGIDTGNACVVGRSTDVGLAMQPQPSSILGDITGAIGGLSRDVSHTVSGPKVQAQLNPDQVIASLDQTPKPMPAPSYRPQDQGFGA